MKNIFLIVLFFIEVTVFGQGSKMKPQPVTNANPVNVTNNPAPVSVNSSTNTINIPKVSKLEDNGNGTMKFTRGDGTSFDSIQVYEIPEPYFVAKYKLANETLLNNIQTIGYVQGGISKMLKTKANDIMIDTLAAPTMNISIPDPSLSANAGYEFRINWSKAANQIIFNYPIYDRILGILYSSTTFVPDNRDYSTIPTLKMADVLFKSFAYSSVFIRNVNGKYFIIR